MSVLTIRRDGAVAVATLDNPPVNAISHEVRAALWDAVDELDADGDIEAVVLVCAGRTFIAGADVREFGAPPAPPHLPDLVGHIEAAQTPWIAAIHGQALGGGLEIAMGCRFRIAAAGAKLGLPEVNLGLVPGASGTVRTPRLAGVETAVRLAVGGKPIPAAEAATAGLVDAVVEGDLTAEAVAFARRAIAEPLPPRTAEREIATPPETVWTDAERTAAKPGHQAPLRALDCLRRATELPFDAALAAERETFLDLRDSEEAAALRHVFFAERAAGRPTHLDGTSPREIRRTGLVGGGTMGRGIATALLDAGLPVVLVESSAEAAGRARDGIAATLDGAVDRGRIDAATRDARLDALTTTDDFEALADVDLAVEAVFEDLDTKRSVFDDLGRICRSDAVLATNTSYIDPREIFTRLPDPTRALGLHFFSPANLMRLVEIVPLPNTDRDVEATAFALARRLGKVPVRAGICDGFIGNRILKTYRAAAEALVRDGVAIAAVDRAMRDYGMKMGPFEAQDLGGLDIAAAQRAAARTSGEDVPETLSDVLVGAGRLGRKSGGGWYDYAEDRRGPAPSDAVATLLAPHVGAATDPGGAAIADHLVAQMAEVGQTILDEGIATAPADIDLVEIHGYGFPRHKGGPMFATGRT